MPNKARYSVDAKYMVRRVAAASGGLDQGLYEIVDRATKKRPWIGDVYVSKNTATRLCADMNREHEDAVREGRFIRHQ